VNISRCALQQECVHFVTALRLIETGAAVGERMPPPKFSEGSSMTRFTKFLLLTVPPLAALVAAPAAAADLGAGFAVNGGATLVSDYRFRGISQTNKRFAVQGTFTLSHSSGFYATWWG